MMTPSEIVGMLQERGPMATRDIAREYYSGWVGFEFVNPTGHLYMILKRMERQGMLTSYTAADRNRYWSCASD